MAVPDFRGSGEAQNSWPLSTRRCSAIWTTPACSKWHPRRMYPLQVPQQPDGFPPAAAARRPPWEGLALSDWSIAARQRQLSRHRLHGGAERPDRALRLAVRRRRSRTWATPRCIGKRYFGSVDEAGARKVAHEFAADILAQFGRQSLFGTQDLFRLQPHRPQRNLVDGSRRLATRSNSRISIRFPSCPAISPDGRKLAFTSYARGNPGIFMFSGRPGAGCRFTTRGASMNATPDFTPDGKQILYSSSASGVRSDLHCEFGRKRSAACLLSRAIEVEPKVNPKTGQRNCFVSGRSGPQQIYRMNMDGTDVERLTNGEGEASNPSWHPDGQIIAFSWTRGYATGNFKYLSWTLRRASYIQLTHERRPKRKPELGARRAAPRVYVHAQRLPPDLDHAGGWNAGAAVDHGRQQLRRPSGASDRFLKQFRRQSSCSVETED